MKINESHQNNVNLHIVNIFIGVFFEIKRVINSYENNEGYLNDYGCVYCLFKFCLLIRNWFVNSKRFVEKPYGLA